MQVLHLKCSSCSQCPAVVPQASHAFPPTLLHPLTLPTPQIPHPLINRSITTSSQQRGVLILPGLGNSNGDYSKLAGLLQSKYGLTVSVAEVARLDWARNFLALTDGVWCYREGEACACVRACGCVCVRVCVCSSSQACGLTCVLAL